MPLSPRLPLRGLNISQPIIIALPQAHYSNFSSRPPKAEPPPPSKGGKGNYDATSTESIISPKIWSHLAAIEKKYSQLKEQLQSGISFNKK